MSDNLEEDENIHYLITNLSRILKTLTPKRFQFLITFTGNWLGSDNVSYYTESRPLMTPYISDNFIHRIRNSTYCNIELSHNNIIQCIATKIYSGADNNCIDFISGFNKAKTNGSNYRLAIYKNDNDYGRYKVRWISAELGSSPIDNIIGTSNVESNFVATITFLENT